MKVVAPRRDRVRFLLGARPGTHANDRDELAQFAPSRAFVGKATALLLISGGALGLVTLFTPLSEGADLPIMLVLAGLTMAAGVVCWFLPWDSWPRWAMHVLVPLSLAFVSLAVAYAGQYFGVYGIYYCVIFVLVGIVHPQGTSLKILPLFAAACFVTVYLRMSDVLLALTYTVLVGLVSAVIGEALAWVTGRFQRSQLALWRANEAVTDMSADLVSMDPQGLAWNAASKLSLRFNVPEVEIYSLADSGALTRLAAVFDGRSDRDGARSPREHLTEWPEGLQVVETREPLNQRTRLTVPLIARERVIGLIEMSRSSRDGAFAAEKITAAGPAFHLVALAIHDAQTLRAEQALANRLASLLDSSRAVSSADTLEEALASVTRCAAEVLGVSDCVAYEYMEELGAIVPRAYWEAAPSGWDGLGRILLLDDFPAETKVLASGRPLLENLSDPDLDPTSREVLENWGEKSCLTVPMLSVDGPMGLLTFWDNKRERRYSDDEMAVAIGLAELAGECIRRNKLVRRLERLSSTDPVTGLANHRQIHEILAKEQARSARSGTPFSVVMIDIDQFKLLNDTHGHPCGDEALRHVTAVLRDSVRATDVVGRYGGDEFVAILPGTEAAAAGVVVQNLLSAISEAPFVTPGGDRIPIHMSFGIAAFPRDAHSVNALMVAADTNLYISKRRGGNVVTGVALEPQEHEGGRDFGLLEAMVTAVDNKDTYTRHHSDQVTTYALMIAEALELSDGTLAVIRAAGLLHDVGKIGIPDRILRKPGRLTEAEYAIVKGHPSIGESLIRAMPDLEEIRTAVLAHHEHFDGSGYPQGLMGRDIPLAGRILCVADSYSAMTTDRPYRKALTTQEAMEELQRGAGSQFAPVIVATFFRCLRTMQGETERALAAPAWM